jgi:deazaflavin-dependent oxidoreductase (nitroreductase family)
MSDYNAQTISEFRKNHGKVGGYFEGAPLVLLTTKGARTKKSHVTPVMYMKDGDRIVVFASKAGADTNPDWYTNLKANPDMQVEIGDEKLDVHADEVYGAERDKLYNEHASKFPTFKDYEKKTKRKIPVVVLTRKAKN